MSLNVPSAPGKRTSSRLLYTHTHKFTHRFLWTSCMSLHGCQGIRLRGHIIDCRLGSRHENVQCVLTLWLRRPTHLKIRHKICYLSATFHFNRQIKPCKQRVFQLTGDSGRQSEATPGSRSNLTVFRKTTSLASLAAALTAF